ncbi:TonB-dependent receptor [Glaciecola sp. XM2]|jgi:outer membrane receptor for ferrienterochelin and colicins|uniref:TonB-dependent receptor plug domain-containing protein n=1 Tax=Glaciecola sp. XM2 TaxID=1914931 RepID=UPI001BDEB13B|nr:TonB-dependent receptor [Glaciecola sp. XM2]MBT1452133.1 TonB-dependent receptor [Glaciecola sp. XM2]
MFSLSRIASLVILFTCASEAIAGQKLAIESNAKEPVQGSGSTLSETNDLHQEDHDDDEDVEKIIVQATRSGRIADELPMRVEIINREEIMEKSTMRPGNISMLVAETGGVRVQTTSPALGSANIRLQGLYGRYTQLLADGLPLYGNQAASIGILQIPPTDLGRVEIIKGSASSLYGGSALGGVINLVSRRPGEEFNGETIVNLTTRDAQDVTTYIESPLSTSLKGSLTAGAHHQKSVDIDNDDWIDLAGYERYTVRPRLFWNGDEGESLYFTAGYMTENRRGGTVDGGVVADGDAFEQTQDSKRFDSGLVFTMPLGDNYTFSTRASAMIQEHNHLFGDVIEDDKHDSYLLESSLSGYTDRSDWVVGLAYLSDIYESDTFPTFDYSYEVPSLFAQVDYEMTSELTTSVSARVDEHSDFGTQVSPRVSLLYRPGDLTIRGSYGKGYYAPTPFVEEIEAAGLSRLAPIQGLVEEQAETASLDFTYTYNNIETSFTLFGSNVENVTELEALSSEENMMLDRVRLVNADGESQIRGSEVLVRYYWHDIKLTASYLYLDATEQATADGDRQKISLTPQHSAGFVAMWEEEDEFRVGFEAYYTGPQRVNDNPFIDESDPYWHLGLMGEITVGRASYFINLENLLDIKQTDEHPLLLPARAPSGQWTTDIWSRNDGFIANAGVRVSF